MAESKIEWTEKTWNPLAGCKEVSPGCTHCYAAVMAKRLEAMGQPKYRGLTKTLDNGKVVWSGKITLDEDALKIPLKRRKPTMYFVNSMSDLFHEDVPDAFIISTFAAMLLSQQHTFQVLTKRPERMRRVVCAPNFGECVYDAAFDLSHMACCGGLMDSVPEVDVLPNVWLGVSVEDQARADERIPLLLKTPAAVRFLSCEPLLSSVDLRHIHYDGLVEIDSLTGDHGVNRPLAGRSDARIGWVIVGGESGQGARPCDIAWVRSIVQQCKSAGVSCFVKQLGGNVQATDGIDPLDQFPNGTDFRQGIGIDTARILLRDKKGGDMEEWPEDLRVRQFPGPESAK